jgi:hypothetical protein
VVHAPDSFEVTGKLFDSFLIDMLHGIEREMPDLDTSRTQKMFTPDTHCVQVLMEILNLMSRAITVYL